MKKLIALLFLTAMSLPARADVTVTDFRILHRGPTFSLRVNLFNTLSTRQGGPITVIFFVRQHSTDTWQKLKEWKDIIFMAPYGRANRTEDNNPMVQKMADTGSFEAMVQVSAPGQADSQQQTSYTATK